MKKFTLIGHHLTHSISPLIHKAFFAIAGFDGDYDITEIHPDCLKEGFYRVCENNHGFNITIPHKINVMPFFDRLSDEAVRLGSVNTAVRENDGSLVGYNTDYYGFTQALRMSGLDKKVAGTALLLGCGGVSKTFAHALIDMGAELVIAARNTEAGTMLANELESFYKTKVRVIDLYDTNSALVLDKPFIANGTPVGMYPNTDASPLTKEVVERASGVFDAIYNPEETLLLNYAKSHGIPYQNGLSMLVLQALQAEQLWNNIMLDDRQIESVIAQCNEALKTK